MGGKATKADGNGQQAELTGAQLNALAALLGGDSITDAATAAGVQRQTVHEWLRSETFAITLNKAKRELWDAQQGALRALGDKAIGVLDDALDSEDGALSLKAAQIVLRSITALGKPSGPTTKEDWVLGLFSTFG
jgi:hypothetical protein